MFFANQFITITNLSLSQPSQNEIPTAAADLNPLACSQMNNLQEDGKFSPEDLEIFQQQQQQQQAGEEMEIETLSLSTKRRELPSGLPKGKAGGAKVGKLSPQTKDQ